MALLRSGVTPQAHEIVHQIFYFGPGELTIAASAVDSVRLAPASALGLHMDSIAEIAHISPHLCAVSSASVSRLPLLAAFLLSVSFSAPAFAILTLSLHSDWMESNPAVLRRACSPPKLRGIRGLF